MYIQYKEQEHGILYLSAMHFRGTVKCGARGVSFNEDLCEDSGNNLNKTTQIKAAAT